MILREPVPQPAALEAMRFALVSRLADDLSHEIKNPLHAMVINLELVRQRVARHRTEGVLDRLDVVDDEIRRVHRLVDGFLRVLRPPQEPDGSVALARLLDEVAPVLEAEARLSRARLELRSAADDAVLHADGRCVKHALLLVLLHAIHCLGGRSGELLLDASCDDGHVHLDLRARLDPEDADEEPLPTRGSALDEALGTASLRTAALLAADAGGAVAPAPGATPEDFAFRLSLPGGCGDLNTRRSRG